VQQNLSESAQCSALQYPFEVNNSCVVPSVSYTNKQMHFVEKQFNKKKGSPQQY